MDYRLWIEEVDQLLAKLDELDLPYPLGTNEVVPKTSGEVRVPPLGSLAVARQIGEFFSVCDGITWPEVRNGYFIVRGDEIGQVKDEFVPTSLDGELAGSVLQLGSNGGGTLFVVRRTSGEVLALPPGGIHENVYDNRESQARIIAADFDGFLSRLKDDLEAFVGLRTDYDYID